MEVNGKRLLVCDCNGTMPLDGRALAAACAGGQVPHGGLEVHTFLCRTQLAKFEAALRQERPVIVACTQEAPLFTEARAEAGLDTDIRFVNIREHAGWSDEAMRAAPKMAALLAEAALDAPAIPMVTVKSAGVTLIYGCDVTAIEAARQIADRLDCTVLLSSPGDIVPPSLADVPIFKGTLVSAKGHMGAFDVVVDDYAPVIPSSRDVLRFEPPRHGAVSSCDLILDISGGPPLFPAHERRDGYLRADPRDPAAVQRALFELVEMVGEFEKPVYIAYDGPLCVHGRAGRRGCTACLDACPTEAITSAGDHVDIDEFICAGCGGCASVCPTGAAAYTVPARETLLERLHTLLATYARAGGETPVLLVHDGTHGEELIATLARRGRGLPAHVIPFHVAAVPQLGLDFFSLALAYGASRLCLLIDPARDEETAGLSSQADLANRALAELGYGTTRVVLLTGTSPDGLDRVVRMVPPSPTRMAPFSPPKGKRRTAARALGHLHDTAPAPVDRVALPPGAPFGTIAIDSSCTLCLSCVTVCPTGALVGTPERSRLAIVAEACVQCGLCASVCPEHAITLQPGLDFAPENKAARVLVEGGAPCRRSGPGRDDRQSASDRGL
ncbi:MAG TPA: 4Fe-4S binding protein [Alphaproteobacteria bacterium]|nr:4Fe-4S binding protein [Alphaproteobacteria bacterium]